MLAGVHDAVPGLLRTRPAIATPSRMSGARRRYAVLCFREMTRDATRHEERQHCPDEGGGDAQCAVGEEALRQHVDHTALARVKHPVALAEEDFVEDREDPREVDHGEERDDGDEPEDQQTGTDETAAQIPERSTRTGDDDQEAGDGDAAEDREGADDEADHEELPDIRHVGLLVFVVELRRAAVDGRFDDEVFAIAPQVHHRLVHDVAEVVHRHLVAHPGLHVIEDLVVLELVTIEARRPVGDRLEARDEGDEDEKHGKHDAEKAT